MVAYMMYYHTLMWVVCRPKAEQHIPVLHRFYLVLLSLGFNLLLCVLYFASDFSLLASHCVDVGGDAECLKSQAKLDPASTKLEECALQHCSSLQAAAWRMADVLLVAVLDVLLWPALKAVFFLWHDPANQARLARVPPRARLALRCLGLGGLVLVLLLTLVHAWRYANDALPVLSEFFKTWPAARITEVFKLMSFWGLLLEYGPPEPDPDSDEESSLINTPIATPVASSATLATAGNAWTAASRKDDPKRVPLLADYLADSPDDARARIAE